MRQWIGRVSMLALAAAAVVLALGGGASRPAASRQTELPCGVVNGGMEDVAPTLTPRDWEVSSEVRSSPRARNGERAVAFLGRFGTISQRLAPGRSAAEGATLSFWVRRDAALTDFRLRVYLGGFELPLTIGPEQVPVGSYVSFQALVPAAVFGQPEVQLVFSFQRASFEGVLDLDDVELDICPAISPTPFPTGPWTPVPESYTCGIRNGSFEHLDGVRPRHWEWLGNVETTTRAMASGARSVRFTQGNASLTQTLRGVPDQDRATRLWLWIYREEGAGGFRMQVWIAGQRVLDYTPLNLPVGQLPVSVPITVPAPGPSGEVTLHFEWAMSGSGAVYLDDVALDLCPGVTATGTPTATPDGGGSSTASATPTDPFGSTATPTADPTGPATATAVTPTPTGTVAPPGGTATRALTPTATPGRPRSAYLPYGAHRAAMPEPAPRVWGLQLALDEDPSLFAVDAELELPRARRAGVMAARTNIRWDAIEPADTTPDQFDWTATDARLAEYGRQGFEVLGTLVAYPPWATEFGCGGTLLPGREADWREFVRAVVTRYGQPPYTVTTWEIGNEVDGETVVRDDDRQRPEGWGRGEPTVPHGGCWGDRAPQYREFLRMAYEEIQAVSPAARVTLGGLAYVLDVQDFVPDFFDVLLAAGGGDYFDVANFHWFPDLSQPLTGPQRVRRLVTSMARYGQRKDVWITETFKLTFTGDTNSEARQAPFLTRELVEVLGMPEVDRVYWYGWMDFPAGYGNVPQYQRGLVRGNHQPKAAFPALPYVVKYTGGAPATVSQDKVVAFRFRRVRAGEDFLVAWSRDGQSYRYTLAVSPGTVAKVTTFPDELLLLGRCCPTRSVAATDGVLTLDVGLDAVFVDLAGR